MLGLKLHRMQPIHPVNASIMPCPLASSPTPTPQDTHEQPNLERLPNRIHTVKQDPPTTVPYRYPQCESCAHPQTPHPGHHRNFLSSDCHYHPPTIPPTETTSLAKQDCSNDISTRTHLKSSVHGPGLLGGGVVTFIPGKALGRFRNNNDAAESALGVSRRNFVHEIIVL